tara:strand:- start:528 stop:1469 length:942 start_codon:yes stop_codon:yes gene_type:complete
MDLENTTVLSSELDKEKFGQTWTVKEVIPENQTTILFGDEDSYKTFIAINLAVQIQNGLQEVAETKQTGVLYLCLENQIGLWERINAIQSLYPNAEPIRINPEKFDILSEEDVIEVTAYCRKYQIGFLVIDTISQAIHEGDESNASTGRNIRNAFTIFNANMITVLAVHHTGKNGSAGARGSSIITYDSPSRLRIKKLKDNKGYLLVDKSKSANVSSKIHFTMIVEDKSLNVIWNKNAESKLTRQILDEVNSSLFAVNELFEILKNAYQDIKPESFRKKLDREIEKLVGQEVLTLVRSENVKYVKRTDSDDEE